MFTFFDITQLSCQLRKLCGLIESAPTRTII